MTERLSMVVNLYEAFTVNSEPDFSSKILKSVGN